MAALSTGRPQAPVESLAGVPISLVPPGLSRAYCTMLARQVNAEVCGGKSLFSVRRAFMRRIKRERGDMAELQFETLVAMHQRFWQALATAGSESWPVL